MYYVLTSIKKIKVVIIIKKVYVYEFWEDIDEKLQAYLHVQYIHFIMIHDYDDQLIVNIFLGVFDNMLKLLPKYQKNKIGAWISVWAVKKSLMSHNCRTDRWEIIQGLMLKYV